MVSTRNNRKQSVTWFYYVLSKYFPFVIQFLGFAWFAIDFLTRESSSTLSVIIQKRLNHANLSQKEAVTFVDNVARVNLGTPQLFRSKSQIVGRNAGEGTTSISMANLEKAMIIRRATATQDCLMRTIQMKFMQRSSTRKET